MLQNVKLSVALEFWDDQREVVELLNRVRQSVNGLDVRGTITFECRTVDLGHDEEEADSPSDDDPPDEPEPAPDDAPATYFLS